MVAQAPLSATGVANWAAAGGFCEERAGCDPPQQKPYLIACRCIFRVVLSFEGLG